jgi:hypothetical protein
MVSHRGTPDVTRRGVAVDIALRFARALATDTGDPLDDPGLLTRAADSVLAADGVGLSVHEKATLRTPLAASNEPAATVERVQFTAGEGPCMLAAEVGLPVFATENLLSSRWPVFYDMIVTHTPVRSVLALPLPGALKGLVVLDVCFLDPAGPGIIDIFAARTVARMVAERLDRAADWSPALRSEDPPWASNQGAQRRAAVWVAVGRVSMALTIPAPDALALMRGHAYATDRTVDDLAADLVGRHVRPDQLRADGGDDRS